MYRTGEIEPEILRRWTHMPGVTALDFDPDSTRVVASSFSTMVCLFNVDPEERTIHLTGYNTALVDVCFNKDATFIATCGASTIVQVFEDPSSSESAYSEYDCCHFGIVNSVDFSQDTKYILTACSDNNVRIIDLERKIPVFQNRCHLSSVNCARYFNSNKCFVSCGNDRVVNIWDPRMPRRADCFMMNGNVSKVTINPNDRVIAAVTAKRISMFDVRTSRHLQQYCPIQNQSFISADFHPKEDWALMGLSNGTVIVADIFASYALFEMFHLMDRLTHSKFSKCGKYFAVCGKDKKSQASLYALKRPDPPDFLGDAIFVIPEYKGGYTKAVDEIKANKMSNQPNSKPKKLSETKRLSRSLEMLPLVANKRAENLNTMSQKKKINVGTPQKELYIESMPSPGVLARTRSLVFSTFDSDFDTYYSYIDIRVEPTYRLESDTDTTPFLDEKRLDVDQPALESSLTASAIHTEIEKSGSSESAPSASLSSKPYVAKAEVKRKINEQKIEEKKFDKEENKEIAPKDISGDIKSMTAKYLSFLKDLHDGEEHLSNQLQRIMRLIEDKKLSKDTPDILLQLKAILIKVEIFLSVYSSEKEKYAIALGDDIDELKSE